MKKPKITTFVKELNLRMKKEPINLRYIHILGTVVFFSSVSSLVILLALYLNQRLQTSLFLVEDYHTLSSNPLTSPSLSPPPPRSGNDVADEELMWRAAMAPRSAMMNETHPKVAFMFLTRWNLPLSPLWEMFFKGHEGFYSIYVHTSPEFTAEPPESSVFYRKRIPSKAVEWGKSSMMDAERRLISHALLEPSNARFVLLSETCIPLFNFTTIYTYLMRSTRSFLGSFDDPRPMGRGRYTPKMLPHVSLSDWRKGNQWFEMSSFFWNVRGFNKTFKHSVVKDWVYKEGLQFGCLLETRVRERKAEGLVNAVFPDWSFLSNYGFNRLGRIWVVWSPKVRLTPCFTSGQMITCSVLMEGAIEEFFCSFIYASNLVEERKTLWEDLRSHQDSPLFRNKPWMIYGDFNEILKGDEHSLYDVNPTIPVGMRDFQDLVRYCSLSDMNSQGPCFTWCNKRERDGELICKKLDRVLVNDNWIADYQQSYSVFEAGGCSDHLRCRIKIQIEKPRIRKPFKFTNALTSDPEFLPMMKEYWDSTVSLFHSTSALYRLSKKLKALKGKIRIMSKNKFGLLTKKTKEAYAELCNCQQETLQNPTTLAIQKESRAYHRWLHLSELEEKYLKQKSKLHWLKVGDGNNKVFFKTAKLREVRNAIKEIKCADGSIVDSQEDMKLEAARFFQEFLAYKPDHYQGKTKEELQDLLKFQCTEEVGSKLTSEVTTDEIRKVLFSMPSNKAPGPDGYTVEFFKETWPIVEKDFVVAIQSFFIKGFIPKGMNATILALIPKKKEVREMKDYRPISCCNVIYKVISKIIANRLKTILPQFISPNQSAFVKDRLLMENVLLASEIVKDYHKDTVSARITIKIDISKAFDSVQWPFLLNVLSALNIPQQFIQWVELCVTTASFSVQVNGELSGLFRSTRGLRQGCSLSPYLFVICMNVLSKMLDKAALERKFGFHPRCQNLKLTHLCFADDLLVFTDGKKRSIEGILQLFTEFAEFSGLKISLEKSTLYMAGIDQRDKEMILQSFPFDSGQLPVRYLGLPLLTKRMTTSDYSPLIEKIRDRIGSWTARHLSFAGRLQLISSVIQSLTNFWISAFRLPSACITEIDRLCSAFLWSGPALNPKKAKVAWNDVCLPREEGGLGLRSIHEANKVSCLKLIWRITSSDSLWAQWINLYLIRKGSFWSLREKTSMGSWMWRKLLKYRELAARFTKVEVMNGRETSFWYDNWSQMGRLIDITGQRGCIDMGITIQSSLAEVIATHKRRRHRVENLNKMEAEIDALKTKRLTHEKDVVLWKGKGDRYKTRFSTYETWNAIREARPRMEWCEGIWFLHATPKHSFISWLVTKNRLATGDRMLTWQNGVNPACVFCTQPIEDRDHLFFKCCYTEEIWSGLSRKILGQKFTTSWSDVLRVLTDKSLGRVELFLVRYTFQLAIYYIWRERNSGRHGETPIPPLQLLHTLDKQVRNRISSIREQGDRRYEGCMEAWFASR